MPYTTALSAPKELPPSQIVKSPLATAENAIGESWTSEPFDSSEAKYRGGLDLIKEETKAIQNVLAGKLPELKGKKPSDIWIYLIRYGLGDNEYVDAAIAAKKRGYNVRVITDLNRSLNFPEGEEGKISTEFAKATYQEGQPAKAIQKLRKAGFRYNHEILSQPIFRVNGPNDMIDILHLKGTIIATEDQGKLVPIFDTTSTANATKTAPRFDRSFVIRDPALSQYALNTIRDLETALRNGGRIKDAPTSPPLRSIYKDGTWIERAYSGGRFNLNNRLSDLLQKGIDAPQSFKIKKITFSHFVLTHTEFLKDLREVMKVQPHLTLAGVLDDKFIDRLDWGGGAALAGQTVIRPSFAPKVPGFPDWLLDGRTELYGYQRGAPGIPESDLEGPPNSRHLWHDKTTLFHVQENGKNWIYVTSGSFNLSNRYQNAEEQVLMKLKADSPLAHAIESSIFQVARSQPEFALPLDQAVYRNTLGHLLARSPLEIPATALEPLLLSARQGNWKTFEARLKKIISVPTQLKKTLPPKTLHERIKRYRGVLEWLGTRSEAGSQIRLTNLDWRKLDNFALLSGHPNVSSKDLSYVLGSALFEEGLSKERLVRRTQEAWNVLGINKRFYDHSEAVIADFSRNPLPVTKNRSAIKERFTFQVFDWDETVANMPTRVILFEKGTDRTLTVNNQEYAHIKSQIGAPGKYENYETRGTHGPESSFRYASSEPGRNYFLEDLKEMVKRPLHEWQGPDWKAFTEALKNIDSAENISILTARGHTVEDFLEGLQFLKSEGWIESVPDTQKLYLVGGPVSNPSGKPIPQAKADIIRNYLNDLHRGAQSRQEKLKPVFIYREDSPSNFNAVKKMIENEFKGERLVDWSNVDIYIKHSKPDGKSTLIQIQEDGTWQKVPENKFESARRNRPDLIPQRLHAIPVSKCLPQATQSLFSDSLKTGGSAL